jgi:formyltetrahydrofolate hydrolase
MRGQIGGEPDQALRQQHRVTTHDANPLVHLWVITLMCTIVGGKPPQEAFDRGVKRIGATAHHVTEVWECCAFRTVMRWKIWWKRVRALEKLVPSRTARWHFENRILLYENKTVILG